MYIIYYTGGTFYTHRCLLENLFKSVSIIQMFVLYFCISFVNLHFFTLLIDIYVRV